MKDVYEEISKELYDNYMSRPKKEWITEIRKTIPIQWSAGYGYYGTDLAIKDGKYFIVHTIGSSCD